MRRSHSRSGMMILSLCVLLIAVALLGNATKADGERRFAPRATTPEELGRAYLTFVILPAMREAIEKLPEAQRPEATAKLTAWSIQLYDAIIDYESNSAVTPEQAIGYLKSGNPSERALAAFNAAVAKASPDNKEAYQQAIAEGLLDAFHVADVERNGGRQRPRIGNPAVALGGVRDWVAKNGGRGGSARIWQLLTDGQPIRFPREPYASAREFLRAGTFSFISSPYTEEAEKLSTALPADEISPPGFPLDAYSDRRLMKQIYEHDFNEHSGTVDPVYAQEFFAQFGRQDGGCPGLALNPIAVTKVTALATAEVLRTDLNLDKPDLLEASRSRTDMAKPGVSFGTFLGTYSRQMALTFRAQSDAKAMVGQYGCDSPVVKRFLANLSDYVLMN
jgi:hypothetical protein